MVLVQDVRDVLTNLSDKRVPDATIEKQIGIATNTIDNEKASDISSATVENAKLVMSVWLTLAAYASKLERTIGGVPPAVAEQLAFWEGVKEDYLEYIKRGTITLKPLVAQPETIYEQSVDGDLDQEPY